MRFANGTTLGSYDILGPLGSGGMGEVYRARDSKLGREVAIKVLPDHFARDPERRARFEREARAVAALSHPNILAIYDFGAHDGTTFAAMELLEGETLRVRLNGGALSVRKAIEIATQIARGLAAAHGKGIVHRDLKPENVFLLGDGQVKVLDFGLARTDAALASAAETVAGTDPGVVMGTVGYMSPEQVRGQAVDARTDLFALGCVLYEMLSGRRAFFRDTVAETMTAILKDEPPDLQGTRTDLSPALERITLHCLEKNPVERFQTARDVAFALESLSGSASSGARAVPPAPSHRALRALAAATVLFAGLFASFVVGRRAAPTLDLAAIEFEAKTFEPQFISNARFLPDGQGTVFSAALEGNEPELFVSRANAAAPQPLGHKRTHLLSVSSTGELAVLTGATHLGGLRYSGTLARMPLDGAPRAWLTGVREADWSPEGSTLALVRDLGGRDLLEYPVGQALYETAGYLSDVRVSPRGDAVAFFDHPVRFDDRGWVKVVDRSKVVRTLAGEFWGLQGLAWTADGAEVEFSATEGGFGNYQPRRVPASGREPARRALASAGSLWIQDVAKDGLAIFLRADRRMSLRALLPGDSQEKEFSWLDSSQGPSLSRDGRRLLFSDLSQSAGSNYATAYRDTSGGQPVRLGEGSAVGFSPDAAWALAMIATPPQLVLYPVGPGDPVRLERGAIERYQQAAWFPDGKHVLFCGNERERPLRCYRQGIAGGPPSPVTPENVIDAVVAPDGQTLVTVSASGDWQVTTIDGGPARPALGFTRVDRPIAWASDGRSLFVQAGRRAPWLIERVDPLTGHRVFVRLIAPPQLAGVTNIGSVSIIGDGAGYAYHYTQRTMTLYSVRGMQ